MIATAIALQRLKDSDVAWKLLRAKQAPMIIAILDSHFTKESRRIPVPEFTNLVDVDLEELRARTDIEIKRSASSYCERWRNDGYLVRRPMPQSRQETYELSSGALAALDYAKRMIQPHRAATKSRLNTIIDQIGSLALALDNNEDNRRNALLEERARIDQQLAMLDQGFVETLDSSQALEHAKDIVHLAREIPTDFAHVRSDFEQITQSIYATIINYDPGHKDLLMDIFDGVDEISQSPSGQSFKGFYSLLRDADLAESVQDNIDTILESSFADDLTTEERQFLRGLLTAFIDQSQEVNEVMTSFSYGLRRFVQSQNYQQERILKQQLDRTLGRAQRVVEAHSCALRIDQDLELTSVSIQPVSRWQLKNPAETYACPISPVLSAEAEVITLAQLREIARETEVDFTELVNNVNACLAKFSSSGESKGLSRPEITVAEVLLRFPATQGSASVIGLIAIALEQGELGEGDEIVRWRSESGRFYKTHIPRLLFTREVLE